MELRAYNWRNDERYSLVGPNDHRGWMDAIEDGHPYRCAPLRLANVCEWWVVAREATFARCGEGGGRDVLSVQGVGESHFGFGVLTFRVPFVFEVDEPWCLHVKGPANFVVANAHPLEGIIDPRALDVGFTMNWLIQPGSSAVFERDGPVAAISLIDPAALHDTLMHVQPGAEHPRRDELERWSHGRSQVYDRIIAGEPGPHTDGAYARAARKSLPNVRFRGLRTHGSEADR